MSFPHIPVVLNTLTLLNVTFVLLAIAGNEFIRRRDARGWRFWIPANALAVLYFAVLHEWWTLALFAYYLLTSIMGLIHWRTTERRAAAQHLLFVRDENFDFFSSPAMRAAMGRMMVSGHPSDAPARQANIRPAHRAEPLLNGELRAAARLIEPLAQPMLIEREAIRIRESVRIMPERGGMTPLEPDFAVLARRE